MCLQIYFCIHSIKGQSHCTSLQIDKEAFLFYFRCAVPHVLEPGPVPLGAVPPAPLPRLLPGRTHRLLHPSTPAILYSAHALTVGTTIAGGYKEMSSILTDQ